MRGGVFGTWIEAYSPYRPGAGSYVMAVVSVSRPCGDDLLCDAAVIMLMGLKMNRSPW